MQFTCKLKGLLLLSKTGDSSLPAAGDCTSLPPLVESCGESLAVSIFSTELDGGGGLTTVAAVFCCWRCGFFHHCSSGLGRVTYLQLQKLQKDVYNLFYDRDHKKSFFS